MTSKKQLRGEIDRLNSARWGAWLEGFEAGHGDAAPWAAHLSRVADAARDEGRREGWIAAILLIGGQGDPDCQPEADSTPIDEVNRFSCGFSCDCRTPMPEPWHGGLA